MNRPITRVSPARWRALGNATLAVAAVAVIGFTTISPAKADYDDWRYRHGWHHHREHWRPYGYGFSYSYPSYSYGYSYSYPSYGYGYYYSYPSYSYYSYPSYDYYYGSSDYGYDYSR